MSKHSPKVVFFPFDLIIKTKMPVMQIDRILHNGAEILMSCKCNKVAFCAVEHFLWRICLTSSHHFYNQARNTPNVTPLCIKNE